MSALPVVTYGEARFEWPAKTSKLQCVVSLHHVMNWTTSPRTNSTRGSHFMNETLPDFNVEGGMHLL